MTVTQSVDAQDFVTTHHFAASRDRVWAAWTRPELLAKWFGPKGSTTRILEYDLRPGGVWRSRLDSPQSGTMFAKSVFREIAAPERLVYEHSFADAQGNIVKAPFFDHWPLVLLTTVTFAEDGEGTLVTLRWSPIDPRPAERDTFLAHFESMRGGWGGSFERLDAELAQEA